MKINWLPRQIRRVELYVLRGKRNGFTVSTGGGFMFPGLPQLHICVSSFLFLVKLERYMSFQDYFLKSCLCEEGREHSGQRWWVTGVLVVLADVVTLEAGVLYSQNANTDVSQHLLQLKIQSINKNFSRKKRICSSLGLDLVLKRNFENNYYNNKMN